MPNLIKFLAAFLLANPEIEGSTVYNAARLKFVECDEIWSINELDCRFTNALETAHRQIIRGGTDAR